MAFEIIVMPSAIADIEAQAQFISKDSPARSVIWLSEIWEKIFSLGNNPKRFAVIRECDRLGIEVRDFIHHSHRIVYLVREDIEVVEILRVYHTARRDLKATDLP